MPIAWGIRRPTRRSANRDLRKHLHTQGLDIKNAPKCTGGRRGGLRDRCGPEYGERSMADRRGRGGGGGGGVVSLLRFSSIARSRMAWRVCRCRLLRLRPHFRARQKPQVTNPMSIWASFFLFFVAKFGTNSFPPLPRPTPIGHPP